MPPITDPAALAQIQQQQKSRTLAQPPASSYYPVSSQGAPMINPGKVAAQNAAEARLTLAEQAAARTAANEAERIALAQQENARQQEEAERKRKKDAATGGVDTTEAENTAAFLTTGLAAHARKIDEVLKAHPEAMKPGWLEWAGSFLGPRVREMATPDEVADIRNVLNNRYADAAEAIIRLGTGAAYTEIERKTAVETLAPQVTDGPMVLADKRQKLREMIIAAKIKSGAAVGQVDRALAEIDKFYGESPKENERTVATGDTKAIELPKGYQDEHSAFVTQNAGRLTPEMYLQFRQQMDAKYSTSTNQFNSDLDPKAVQIYVDGVNKGQQTTNEIPVGDVKMSESEKAHNDFARSPVGTGITSLANAGSFGAVDALMSQEQRELKEKVASENWKSDMAGEVVGSIAPMKALELGATGLLKKLGPDLSKSARAKFFGDVGVSSVYGGMRGAAGADEGEGVQGAIEGASVGAAAGTAAGLVTKGGLPFTSKGYRDAVEVAPSKTVEAFNRDNGNRALRYIGEKIPKKVQPGTEMTDFIHGRLSNAYEGIKPHISGTVDGPFDNAFIAMKASAKTPEKKAMWAEIQATLDNFRDKTTGVYTGQGYKDASERLRYLAKTWSTKGSTQGDVAADDMARLAEQARKQMQSIIMRQTPAVGQKLKQVERGWAHLVRIEDATNRALKSGEGHYGPGHYIDAIKKNDTSARKNASSRGRAFDQPYAMASDKVLGPGGAVKLGMGERLRFATIAGGLAMTAGHDPKVAGIVSALSYGLYGPRAKKIASAILVGKRPSKLDNEYIQNILANELRRNTTGD